MKCLCGKNMEERKKGTKLVPACGGESCLTCGHNPQVREERSKMKVVPLGNGLEGIVIKQKEQREAEAWARYSIGM